MLNKITAKWEPVGQVPKVYANQTFKMRSMQTEAYATLSNKRHVIINAPAASGKTLTICWILAKRLVEDPLRKAIIAVPQTIIASGFRGYFNLSFSDEDDNKIDSLDSVRWSPAHYLCRDTKESNISQLISFLQRQGNKSDLNDRIVICSHASLIDAFKKSPDLFKHADICIDEAHHIKFTLLEDDEEAEADEDHTAVEFCNKMGELVSHSLKSEDVSLILSTATMFRGDRLEIIPRSKISEFERFYYPMDSYLRDCHWLESFSYDFAMYEGRWGDRMSEIFKESIGRTIVYLPSVRSKYYSYGSKGEDLRQIYRAIAGGEPTIKEDKSGLTLIKRGQEWVKVVNLVNDAPTLREKRKELIIAAHGGDGSDIDIVIALNMFREGANWKWANREIIIGSKGSLTDMNQILGRLFRDAKDKRHVHAIQLLPFSFDQLDKDKFRDQLNEYSKTVFATMLFEDAIAPADLQLPVRRDTCTGRLVSVDHLRDQVDDENTIFQIWEEIRDAAIKEQDNGVVDFGKNDAASRKIFAEIVSEVLAKHEVTEFHTDIAEAIRRRWIREAIRTVDGSSFLRADLSGIDFEVIQVNPLQHFLTYSSTMCGLDTFGKFRDALERRGVSETYNLEACFPKIAAEWHPTKNGRLRARDFAPKSCFKVWWECENGHAWKTSVNSRVGGGHRCPYCSGRMATAENNLQVKNPDISAEWSPKNKLGPENYLPNSDFKALWICKNGHEWAVKIDHRTSGSGCPICRGRAISADKRRKCSISFEEARAEVKRLNIKTSLEYLFRYKESPVLPSSPQNSFRDKWNSWSDFLDNGRAPPTRSLSFNEAKETTRRLDIKTKEEYCRRYKEALGLRSAPSSVYKDEWVSWADFLGTTEYREATVDNNLELLFPDIAKEWDHTRNGGMSPSQFRPQSGKRADWICPKGHKYTYAIQGRTKKGCGCPLCSRRIRKTLRVPVI